MEELVSEGKRFCACSCGILIDAFDKQRRPRKWANGHFNRKQRSRVPCACGCGIVIDAINEHGEARRFVHGHNSRNGLRANENNGQWNGGRTINDHGYIEIRSVGHRRAHKPGYYVGEHVLVMEEHLNACLCDWSIVHHINEVKTDNRIKNLMVFTTNGQHHSHHHRQRRISRALFHLFQ